MLKSIQDRRKYEDLEIGDFDRFCFGIFRNAYRHFGSNETARNSKKHDPENGTCAGAISR